MNIRKITKIAIPVVVVVVAIYDIWAEFHCGDVCTISRVAWGWSANHPFLPIWSAALLAHLYCPAKGPETELSRAVQWFGLAVLITIGIFDVSGVTLMALKVWLGPHVLASLSIGFAVGYVFLSQHPDGDV